MCACLCVCFCKLSDAARCDAALAAGMLSGRGGRHPPSRYARSTLLLWVCARLCTGVTKVDISWVFLLHWPARQVGPIGCASSCLLRTLCREQPACACCAQGHQAYSRQRLRGPPHNSRHGCMPLPSRHCVFDSLGCNPRTLAGASGLPGSEPGEPRTPAGASQAMAMPTLRPRWGTPLWV